MVHIGSPSVSNAAWADKRGALEAHDVLLMTRRLRRDRPAVWSEAAIDARTTFMIDALLATWPVPPDHVGAVEQAPVQSTYVSLKMLVASDALPVGAELLSRDGNATAVVTADGMMRVHEGDHDTPSGAGRAVSGHAVNGWYFWRLRDGRRLVDLRNAYARTVSDAPVTEGPVFLATDG